MTAQEAHALSNGLDMRGFSRAVSGNRVTAARLSPGPYGVAPGDSSDAVMETAPGLSPGISDLGTSGLSQGISDLVLAGGTDILSGVTKDFLYELVEGHVLQFGDAIQANQRLASSSLGLDSTWSSWKRMQEVLTGLAFRWGNADPFFVLGLSLNEGPPPTLSSISQRWDMAEFILQVGMGMEGLRNEWHEMGRVRELVLAAKDDCSAQIKGVRSKKVKPRAQSLADGTRLGSTCWGIFARRSQPPEFACNSPMFMSGTGWVTTLRLLRMPGGYTTF